MKSEMQKSASNNGFTVDNKLACRGDGRFYMKLNVKSSNAFTTLHCAAYSDGTSIPTCAYPLDARQHGAEQAWILETPLMEARGYSFVFHLDDNMDASTELSLSSKQIAWMSRINYRLNREACMEIRDFESEHFYKHYQIVFTNRFDGSNCAIWRAYVRFSLEHEPQTTNLAARLCLGIIARLKAVGIVRDETETPIEFLSKHEEELEELVVRKYCTEDVSFSRFVQRGCCSFPAV